MQPEPLYLETYHTPRLLFYNIVVLVKPLVLNKWSTHDWTETFTEHNVERTSTEHNVERTSTEHNVERTSTEHNVERTSLTLESMLYSMRMA